MESDSNLGTFGGQLCTVPLSWTVRSPPRSSSCRLWPRSLSWNTYGPSWTCQRSLKSAWPSFSTGYSEWWVHALSPSVMILLSPKLATHVITGCNAAVVFQDEKAQVLTTYLWLKYVSGEVVPVISSICDANVEVVNISLSVVEEWIYRLGPSPVRRRQAYCSQGKILVSRYGHKWVVSGTPSALMLHYITSKNNDLICFDWQHGSEHSPRSPVCVPVQ